MVLRTRDIDLDTLQRLFHEVRCYQSNMWMAIHLDAPNLAKEYTIFLVRAGKEILDILDKMCYTAINQHVSRSQEF